MRLSSLLLVASVAVVGCASSSHDGDSSESAEDMTGIANTMNLRMEYDVASSTIRATVGSPLSAGETLRLNIRRGRLPQNTAPQLDCSSLPVAPPMAATSASQAFEVQLITATWYAPQIDYQGPLIDPSLLATVYPADWIEAHVSAKGLAELQTEGADSIVEACIMNATGSYARSRVQTTIANAWNQDDPILDGHALTGPASSSSGGMSTAAKTE